MRSKGFEQISMPLGKQTKQSIFLNFLHHLQLGHCANRKRCFKDIQTLLQIRIGASFKRVEQKGHNLEHCNKRASHVGSSNLFPSKFLPQDCILLG